MHTRRAALSQIWKCWRLKAEESRWTIKKIESLQRFLRGSQLRRGLSTWRSKTGKARAVFNRGLAVQCVTHRSQLVRAWFAWSSWHGRRACTKNLGISLRHSIQHEGRAFALWRILYLCSTGERLRAPRVMREHFITWRFEALRGKRVLALDSIVCDTTLRGGIAVWLEGAAVGRHANEIAAAECRLRARSLCSWALATWRDWQLWIMHLRQMIPVVETGQKLRLLRTTWAHWCRWASIRGVTSERRRAVSGHCAKKRTSRALYVWRRTASVFRLHRALPALEHRCQQRLVHESFRHFVEKHVAFQSAVELLATQRPAVPELMKELLGRPKLQCQEALQTWRARTLRQRLHLLQRRALPKLLQRRKLRAAVTAWASWRTKRATRVQQRGMVDSFLRCWSTAGLSAAAFRDWAAMATAASQHRLNETRAEEFNTKRRIRMPLLPWAKLSRQKANARSASDIVWNRRRFDMLTRWRLQFLKERHLRLAALQFLNLRSGRCASVMLLAWSRVARALAVADTRRLLQAHDVRTSHHVNLCSMVTGAWRAETARTNGVLRNTRLKRLFGCWMLHVQEQILLRRYLTQCSAANFEGRGRNLRAGDVHGTGRGGRSRGVQPAEFELLYERMAEQRWGVVELVSD